VAGPFRNDWLKRSSLHLKKKTIFCFATKCSHSSRVTPGAEHWGERGGIEGEGEGERGGQIDLSSQPQLATSIQRCPTHEQNYTDT